MLLHGPPLTRGNHPTFFSNSPTNSVPKVFCDFNHISMAGARASFDYRKIVLCGGVIMSEAACEPTLGKRKTNRRVAPLGNWIEQLGLSLFLLLLVAAFLRCSRCPGLRVARERYILSSGSIA